MKYRVVRVPKLSDRVREKSEKVDLHEKYRVSGARLRAEVKKWDDACARALERYMRRLEHELEMDYIDGRRDW